jgi:hypothetical protein
MSIGKRGPGKKKRECDGEKIRQTGNEKIFQKRREELAIW